MTQRFQRHKSHLRQYGAISGALPTAALLFTMPVQAEPDAQSSSAASHEAEVKSAADAAMKVAVRGPTKITLANEAVIEVPEGESYIPAQEADRLMVALGNTASGHRVGLIVPQEQTAQWLIDIDWINEG